MELVIDANVEPARQLNDVVFVVEKTRIHHNTLMMRVVRVLCAGGMDCDLS